MDFEEVLGLSLFLYCFSLCSIVKTAVYNYPTVLFLYIQIIQVIIMSLQ